MRISRRIRRQRVALRCTPPGFAPRAILRAILLNACCGSLLLCQSLPVGNVSTILISPASAGTLYAGTPAGVFWTSDSGLHWTRRGLASVSALAFVPASPDTLYAATAFGLSKTTDAGRNWTTMRPVGCAYSVAIPTQTPLVTYAGTCGWGVIKTSDGGLSWAPVNSGLPAKAVVWDLAIDPLDAAMVYAATGDGIFKSTDGGDNWSLVTPSFPNTWIYSLAIEPHNGQVLYAGTNGRGVLKSENQGLTWSDLSSSGRAVVRHVAIDGSNPETVYASTDKGILRTVDAGLHWPPLGTQAPFGNTLHVAVDPTNPKNLYAGSFGFGLFHSNDAGASWMEADSGIQSVGINAIALEPEHPEVVLAGTDSLGIFRSVDAGATWTRIGARYPGRGLIRAIGIQSASPAHSIYTSDLNDGVFVSSDSGESWTRAPWPGSLGPIAANYARIPNAIAFHPTRAGVVYAGVFGAGIFRSTNGGQNWTPLSTGLSATGIDALVIDPSNPDALFAAGGEAVFRSSDGGQNWVRTATKFRVRALALCSERPGSNTWYAGGTGMFKTTDGGHTWTAVDSGLPIPILIRSLAVDPAHCDNVYAGTEGSGMYKTVDGGQTWRLVGGAGILAVH